jgi:Hsp20/alpha crystallin family
LSRDGVQWFQRSFSAVEITTSFTSGFPRRGSLSLSGTRERKDEVSKDGLYRYERRFGSFTRTMGLPQGVTEDPVKADYKNGVLEVHVQKPEQPKPRRIQIGSGEHATIEGKSSQK